MAKERTPKEISQEHIESMYSRTCKGISIISAILPPLLIWYANKCNIEDIPGSMSEYYTNKQCTYFYADWARSGFVGTLFIIGTFLIIFPALTKFQIILKFSGIMALVVALFPTGQGNWVSKVHVFAAIFLFIPIFLLALISKFRTDYLIKPEEKQKGFAKIYYAAAILMVVGCIFVFLLDHYHALKYGRTFWIEAVCIWGFSIFWWARSNEVLYVARN